MVKKTKEEIQEIKRHFESMLKQPNLPDYLMEIGERIVKHPKEVMYAEDSFNFDNTRCLTHCDGSCCAGATGITLTPVEIDSIWNDKKARRVFKKEIFADRFAFMDTLFEIHIGFSSHIPVATFKFLGGPLKICPFLTNAKKIFIGKNLRVENVDSGGVCLLEQPNKPQNCALYPLGRVLTYDATNHNKLGKVLYFYSNKCACTETGKKTKIADFVDGYEERHELMQDFVLRAGKMAQKIHPLPEPKRQHWYRIWIGILYFSPYPETVAEKMDIIEKFWDDDYFHKMIDSGKPPETPRGTSPFNPDLP